MSGGHFGYRDNYLEYIAEQLKQDVEFNEVEYDDSGFLNTYYGFQHEEETIKYLKLIIHDLYKLREMLHEYDYAVSGDSSIDYFLEKARLVYQRNE